MSCRAFLQAIRSRDIKGEFDRLNFPTGEDNNDYDLMTRKQPTGYSSNI